MCGERYIYEDSCKCRCIYIQNYCACVKTHVEEFVSKFTACNTYLHMHSIDWL